MVENKSVFLRKFSTKYINYLVKRIAPYLIGVTLVTACGGGEDDSTSTPETPNGGTSACNVNVANSINVESNRFDNELQNRTSDSDELLLRESQIGQVYDVGDFLNTGNFIRRIDTSGQQLPPVDLASIRIESSFSSDSANANSNSASATFMAFSGLALGATISQAENRRIVFDSQFQINNLRLRQLNNTQEAIDINRNRASDANQFVYGIFEGDVLTTISVAAGCDELSETEIQAALDGVFDVSSNFSTRRSEGTSGAIEIVSTGRVPIAYFIREIDPRITIPNNLGAGIENDRSILLQWDNVDSISNYRVFYSSTPGFNRDTEGVFVADVTENEFMLRQGVDLGETLHFRVASIVGGVLGDLSDPLPVTVPLVPPQTALRLSATPQANGNIELNWSPSEGNSANNYTIFRREGINGSQSVLASIRQSNGSQNENFRRRTFIDTNVREGVQYEYQITYENLLSPPSSPPSDVITVIGPRPSVDNNAPEAIILPISPVDETDVVTLNGSDSFDPDNDPLTFRWEAANSNAVAVTIQNPNSSTATFVAPEIDLPLVRLEFELSVSDGDLIDREFVEVTVFNSTITISPNSPPEPRVVASETEVLEGEPITLDASASTDADGDNLTFSWQQTSQLDIDTGIDELVGPIITFNTPTELEEDTTFEFTVIVSDGRSAQTERVQVTVQDRGQARIGLLLGLETQSGTLQADESDFWSLIVTNTSDFIREGVVLRAPFPSESLQDLARTNIGFGGDCEDRNCNSVNDTIVWQLGDLNPGEIVTVGLNPRVRSNIQNQQDIDFTAIVSDDLGASSPSSLNIPLMSDRRLELSLVSDEKLVVPGGDVNFTLAYGFSQASNQAQNTQLVFEFPSGFTFRNASDNGELSVGDDSSTVVWQLGNLQRGENGTVNVGLRVNEDLVSGQQLRSGAAIFDSSAQTSPTTANQTLLVADTSMLRITVDVNHNPVIPGQQTDVFLNVTNPGDQMLENITASFRLEENGFDRFSDLFVSDSGDCDGSTCDANEWVNWTIPQLDAGASRRFSFPAFIPQLATRGGTINLLTFYDVNSQRVIHNAGALAVANSVELEVALSINKSPLTAGEDIRYEVAYLFNGDSSQAENVTLQLELPRNTTFGSASNNGTFDGRHVNWSLSTLQPGMASGVFSVDARVNPDAVAGELLESKVIMSNGPLNRTIETLSTPVTTERPLDLVISSDRSPISIGQRMPIFVTVSNTSEFPRDNVVVQMRYQPEWSSINEAFITNGGACSGTTCESPEPLEWNIAELDANSSQTFTFLPAVQNNSVDNIIQINGTVRDASNNRANAIAQFIVNEQDTAELSIEVPQLPLIPGETVTVDIRYATLSTGLTNGQLNLDIPEELLFVSASNGGTLSNGQVRWNFGTVGANENGRVALTFTVVNNLERLGEIPVLTAQLFDLTTSNNNGIFARTNAQIPIAQARPLQVTLSSSNETPALGDPINVSINVTNSSSFQRSNLSLVAVYPEGFSSIRTSDIPNVSCSGSTCEPRELLIWNIGTLLGGESAQLTLNPTIDGVTSGAIIMLEAAVQGSKGKIHLQVIE